ncbi:MAG: hypothetical protein ACEQR8_06940 [Cypionkella sp.]
MSDLVTAGTQGSSNATTSPLREEISGDAARLAETAKQKLDQAAEGPKQTVTEAARSATSAIDRAATALREDDAAPDWLAKSFESAARQVENLASSLEGKNLDDLRRSVTSFARQNPMVFLAASAAAGFAAARFLRAGSEFKSHEQSSGGQLGQGFGSSTSGAGDNASAFPSADTPIYGGSTTPEFTS